MEIDKETYLGDGVYALFDGYHIWLRAERYGFQHRVALEPPVLASLDRFVRSIYAKVEPPDAG
jgi:hypothetical protein